MGKRAGAAEGKTSNLKPPQASFFGRERELADLDALLASDRLVTLHGPAGTGKTRLSIRWGELHRDAIDRGVWFADLTTAHDLDGVCAAVARAVDVPLRANSDANAAIEQLGRALDGAAIVLILDNCEQCTAHAAKAVERWLDLAPRARFIATSREVLHVAGERVQELGPLGLPQGEHDADSEAVRLFVDRARRVRPGWNLAPADLEHVIEIVRHLDGLPLAIELAAARMSMMGAGDLLKRLPRRFDVLSSPTRGTTERQRTLRGALDWSWDLSSEWERAALVQCAVFRGPFALDAAERVLALPSDAPPVLDAVRTLRDKSYLRSYEPPELPGEAWLAMYESIREWALEKNDADAERAKAEARHMDYNASVAEALADAVWGKDGAGAIRRLGAMRDDMLAAHERAMKSGRVEVAVRIAIALERVALDRGPHGMFAPIYDRTIEAGDGKVPDELLGRLLMVRSFLRMLSVNRPGALADAERAASIARAGGDLVLEVRSLQVIGQVAVPIRDEEAIARCTSRLSAIADETKDSHLEGLARMVLGLLCVVRGVELERSHRELERSLACMREVGDAHRLATVLNVLGVLLGELGKPVEARDALEQAIDVCLETNDRFREASCLAYLGGVHIEAGHIEEACACLERAVGAFASLGERWQQALARGTLGGALAMKGDIARAARTLDQAESDLAAVGDEVYVSAVRVHRGQLDLARARECNANGDVVGAARHRADAEARLADADERRADDVRFAARMLRRELSRAPEAQVDSLPGPETLIVAADGHWFRPPHGKRIELATRRNLALLLHLLAERRMSAPGEAVSYESLLDRGWPGERVVHDAATNRVRVAMTTLRRMGLAEVLRSAHEGYWLTPEVPLVIGR